MGSRHGLVCGIGINDADYTVRRKINGVNVNCPFYESWSNMLKRCYSKTYQSRKATYIGCTVSDEWFRFMAFREWMISQEWKGNHLDKDLIFQGNKIYSADKCVFISPQLNTFTTDSASARGQWPIGVSWRENLGKFISQCRNPFNSKREFLGVFDCPEDAHEAWMARKHQHACRYAETQSDPRIAKALRIRYADFRSN